ncbi:MAG: autotransporter domain-containing protein [Sphingomonas sp.]|nr:MAG: autotransporter domain-containing protein [Sphingomonas sp.]
MRAFLLASTCCLSLTSAAAAETSITGRQTGPVRTSTIKQGAADDILITTTGVVETSASGAAVTVDSANKVINAGSIQFSNINNATGILALAGTSGGIVNSGKIIVDETYSASDGDNDGDLDGPFAVGSNRAGIVTQGAYSGNIENSGSIAIEGNDSAGIRLGGPLTGALVHNGTTNVLGDRAIGIQTQDVSGPVRLAGSVSAQGVDAVAARFDGSIAGTLTVQGSISSSGYRYTTAPADSSKLDADDLLQGGPALIVAGDVQGGIILAIPPKDNSPTDNDEDKDGIEDSKEGSALVQSFGAAPAMRIGATDRDIAIGAVPATGNGYGLIIDGRVQGSGVYSGVQGNGLQIGGLGGNVTIAGGVGVKGTVSATAVGASATAIRLGSGAATPLIHNMGQITASGSNAASTVATAIAVDAGASLPTIRNAGSIKATATGEGGSATAIIDRSGTLALIENSGAISASGAKADSGRNIAIDVSGTATGVTIRQTAVATGIAAPAITGNILFGSGADVLDLSDGSFTGDTSFGDGADTLRLSGDAVYTGKALFGSGGATMNLAGTSQFRGTADFGGAAGTLGIGSGTLVSGRLDNAANVAISIAGGRLELASATQISSLDVSGKGVITVTLNEAGNSAPIIGVAGSASFAADSKLDLRVSDISKALGTHLVLRAGTLTGASNISTDTLLLPFLYKGTLNAAGNDLNVTLSQKSTTELGLNRSEAAAFSAIHAALVKDQKMGGAFVALTDGDLFRSTLRQMLPDHAGGIFSAVTQGSRTFTRMLEDPTGPFEDKGKWGYWVNQSGWGLDKGLGETAGFRSAGWGFGGGAELKTGIGSFGASVAYLWNQAQDRSTDNDVQVNQYELAAYWRLKSGGFRGTARGSVAFLDLDGTRRFKGLNGTEKLDLTASADRAARLYSGSASVSHQTVFGILSVRPQASLDYYRLNENGYTESGGGSSFDLIVQSRSSDEMAASASVSVGIEGGGEDEYSGWSRLELEGGRRQIVSGRLGNTVARFSGGEEFTLVPEDRDSGWTGRLRGVLGNNAFQVAGELGAEQQQGNWALSARASLRIGL